MACTSMRATRERVCRTLRGPGSSTSSNCLELSNISALALRSDAAKRLMAAWQSNAVQPCLSWNTAKQASHLTGSGRNMSRSAARSRTAGNGFTDLLLYVHYRAICGDGRRCPGHAICQARWAGSASPINSIKSCVDVNRLRWLMCTCSLVTG